MASLCGLLEPAVRLAVYRKHKDASQAVKLYKELVQMEAKRRCWSDVIEILQAVAEEPLFRGTTVYLAAVIACALKCAGDVAVNRGLESDGAKFADAKPHADWDGGFGNAVRFGSVSAWSTLLFSTSVGHRGVDQVYSFPLRTKSVSLCKWKQVWVPSRRLRWRLPPLAGPRSISFSWSEKVTWMPCVPPQSQVCERIYPFFHSVVKGDDNWSCVRWLERRHVRVQSDETGGTFHGGSCV
jgi:hypothetical protein